MTSFAQPPFDIESDPFVINCRKMIESLILQVGTVCHKTSKPDRWVWCESYYLYFDDTNFAPSYSDFLIKAFADKKELHPPVKVTLGGKFYICTFYKQHFRFADNEIKSYFWDKESTLSEKEKIKSFLNKYVIQYFYDYLSF